MDLLMQLQVIIIGYMVPEIMKMVLKIQGTQARVFLESYY